MPMIGAHGIVHEGLMTIVTVHSSHKVSRLFGTMTCVGPSPQARQGPLSAKLVLPLAIHCIYPYSTTSEDYHSLLRVLLRIQHSSV